MVFPFLKQNAFFKYNCTKQKIFLKKGVGFFVHNIIMFLFSLNEQDIFTKSRLFMRREEGVRRREKVEGKKGRGKKKEGSGKKGGGRRE